MFGRLTRESVVCWTLTVRRAPWRTKTRHPITIHPAFCSRVHRTNGLPPPGDPLRQVQFQSRRRVATASSARATMSDTFGLRLRQREGVSGAGGGACVALRLENRTCHCRSSDGRIPCALRDLDGNHNKYDRLPADFLTKKRSLASKKSRLASDTVTPVATTAHHPHWTPQSAESSGFRDKAGPT